MKLTPKIEQQKENIKKQLKNKFIITIIIIKLITIIIIIIIILKI